MYTTNNLQKILIIRFSSIGDIVLTTPIVRCIKQQFPKCEIHYLTKSQFADILKNNVYIDKVQVLGQSLIGTSLSLKNEGFDYIIDLHNNLRTRIIKGILDIPSSSFNKLNFEKWIYVKTGINILPKKHIVERYFETTKSLGVLNDYKGLDYFIPEDITLPFELPKNYIAIAIGAQHYTKRFPVDQLIKVCSQLNDPIILLGGKEDATSGKIIVEKSGSHVINKCGELSLNQSALVVKKSIKVITNDTGLMHIAAAFQKEIISIWGNTTPLFGMNPYYGNANISNQLFEVQGLDCRPCSKIGFNACPKKHFNCMMQQDIEGIIEASKSKN